MRKYLGISLLAAALVAVYYVGGIPKKITEKVASQAGSKVQVTFVELGSVNCIPCRAMQPVMRDLEKRFGDQIHIVFHDVQQDEAPARIYNIRVIPTQVFLDKDGREFHRHEGFYPLQQIESLLRARGLKALEDE